MLVVQLLCRYAMSSLQSNPFYPFIKDIQESVNVLLTLDMTDKVCKLCNSKEEFEDYIAQLNKLYSTLTFLLLHTNQIVQSNGADKKLNRLIRDLKSRKSNKYECIGVLLNIEHIINQLQLLSPELKKLIIFLLKDSTESYTMIQIIQDITKINRSITDQINSDKLAIKNYFFETLTCDIQDSMRCLINTSDRSRDLLNEML